MSDEDDNSFLLVAVEDDESQKKSIYTSINRDSSSLAKSNTNEEIIENTKKASFCDKFLNKLLSLDKKVTKSESLSFVLIKKLNFIKEILIISSPILKFEIKLYGQKYMELDVFNLKTRTLIKKQTSILLLDFVSLHMQ